MASGPRLTLVTVAILALLAGPAAAEPIKIGGLGSVTRVMWNHEGEEADVSPTPNGDAFLGRGANGQVFAIKNDPNHVLKLPVSNEAPIPANIADEVSTFRKEVAILNFVKNKISTFLDEVDQLTSEELGERETGLTRAVVRSLASALDLVHVPVVEAASAEVAGGAGKDGLSLRGGADSGAATEVVPGVVKQRADGVELDVITGMLKGTMPKNSDLGRYDAAQCSQVLKGLMNALVRWGAEFAPGQGEPYHLTDWKLSNMMWGRVPGSPDCADRPCLILIDLMQMPNGDMTADQVSAFYRNAYETLGSLGFGPMADLSKEEHVLNQGRLSDSWISKPDPEETGSEEAAGAGPSTKDKDLALKAYDDMKAKEEEKKNDVLPPKKADEPKKKSPDDWVKKE